MVSKYQLEFQEIKTLGKGGYSTVFEVKSLKNSKSFAVKKIPFEEKDRKKTLKEIDVLKQLSSDYVVGYIDSWIENNYYINKPDTKLEQQSLLLNHKKSLLLHIQRELCSMSLNEVIKVLIDSPKNSMKVSNYSIACEIAVQMFECVEYLHNLYPPIIHRDLKPENIMILKGGQNRCIKLVDFGLSTYHEFIEQSHTKYIGTRTYRALELNKRTYDTKADVYSLGIIMSELFNIDLNDDSNNVDDIIQDKFKYAKETSLRCLGTVPKTRPTCSEILKNKYLWVYSTENHDLYASIKSIASEKYQTLFQNKFDENKYETEYQEVKDVYGSSLIGYGTYSKISKVRNITNDLRAIKKLYLKDFSKYELHDQKDYVHRILDKVLIWSSLNNPFLVNYKSYWMEFVDSEAQAKLEKIPVLHIEMDLNEISLKNVLNAINKEINQESSLTLTLGGAYIYSNIFREIVRGIYYLHSQSPSIIHGNLKLTNILLSNYSSNTCVKICDFEMPIEKTSLESSKTISQDLYSLCYIFKCLHNMDNKVKTSVFLKVERNFPHLSIIYKNLKESIIFMEKIENNEIIDVSVSKILEKAQEFNLPFAFYKDSLSVKHILNVEYTPISKNLLIKFAKTSALKMPKTKSVEQKFNFFTKKWQMLKNMAKEIKFNCKFLTTFEESEKKAIIITNSNLVLAQTISEHIDSSFQDAHPIYEFSMVSIQKIVSGNYHVLCLSDNMEIYSFGDNSFGQLGIGTVLSYNTPIKITKLIRKKIIDIKCGQNFSIALTNEGKIYSWGAGSSGQLGNNLMINEQFPVQVNTPVSKHIVNISCGYQHCLALTKEGYVYGWGSNRYGQLGTKTYINQSTPQLIKIKNNSNDKIKEISCGRNHSLLLSVSGEIFSFGSNRFSQLGIKHNLNNNRPIKIKTPIKFKNIYTCYDEDISVAISQTDKYYFWGKCGKHVYSSPKVTKYSSKYDLFLENTDKNKLYQTIYRNEFKVETDFLRLISKLNVFNSKNTSFTFTSKIVSLTIVTIKEIKAIFATNSDLVYTMRINSSIDSGTPKQLPELSMKKIRKVVCTDNSFLFLTENKKVFSWFWEPFDQPVTPSDYSGKSIQTFKEYLNDEICEDIFTCNNSFNVLSESGNLYKINSNSCDRFISNNDKIINIACGSRHIICITESGSLLSYGYNHYGQLGISNNNYQDDATPLDFESFTIKKICCGKNHTLMLSHSGSIFSFGQNKFGQLGTSDNLNQNKPRQVKTPVRFIDIAATYCDNISSGLSEDGIYYIWGDCNAILNTPIPSQLTSFDEIFASYSKQRYSPGFINFNYDK